MNTKNTMINPNLAAEENREDRRFTRQDLMEMVTALTTMMVTMAVGTGAMNALANVL